MAYNMPFRFWASCLKNYSMPVPSVKSPLENWAMFTFTKISLVCCRNVDFFVSMDVIIVTARVLMHHIELPSSNSHDTSLLHGRFCRWLERTGEQRSSKLTSPDSKKPSCFHFPLWTFQNCNLAHGRHVAWCWCDNTTTYSSFITIYTPLAVEVLWTPWKSQILKFCMSGKSEMYKIE